MASLSFPQLLLKVDSQFFQLRLVLGSLLLLLQLEVPLEVFQLLQVRRPSQELLL